MEDFTDTQQMNGQQNQSSDSHDGQLQACKAELAHMSDRVARLQADFENYKRRQEKERAAWFTSAQSMVLLDLLAIVDDFERAMSEAQKNSGNNPELTNWLMGFVLIEKSLSKVLAKFGVTVMTDFTTFDPEKHEAIMQVDSEKTSGSIVDVLQKGYLFKDTVLRPAKVSVAK